MKDYQLQILIENYSIARHDYFETLKIGSDKLTDREYRKECRELMDAAMTAIHEYVEATYTRKVGV